MASLFRFACLAATFFFSRDGAIRIIEHSGSQSRAPSAGADIIVEQRATVSATSKPVTASNGLSQLAGDAAKVRLYHFDSADIVYGHEHAPDIVQLPVQAYFGSATFLVCAVVFSYWPHGPRVVTVVLVYLAALSTMVLSVKWVLSTHAFSYPLLVTTLHFLSGGVATGLVLISRKVAVPVPTAHEFWVLIFPIAIALAGSIGAASMALTHCSVAFAQIIESATCLTTIALVVAMGMPFDVWLTLPALIVATGCALTITGEVHFSAYGFLLCCTSNAFRSIKATLQQKLMTGESREKFDPATLLFWISLPSTGVMLAASLLTEGTKPYGRLASMDTAALQGLVVAVAASCVNATVLHLAQLCVIRELGAVGSEVAGLAGPLLAVLGSMVLFADLVTSLQMVGFMQVLLGVFIYSRMDAKSNATTVATKAAGGLLK